MITTHTKRLKLIFKTSFLVLVLSSFSHPIATKNNQFGTEKITFKTNNSVVPTNMDDDLREDILRFGQSLLGTPYVYAGTSAKGFDCSGFVYYVFKNFDIKVPRSSSQFKNFGQEIPIAEVKKGDILLFLSPTRKAIGHVGIVSEANGMDSNFIHASSSREMKVMISSLKQKGYTRRFVKAVRVLE